MSLTLQKAKQALVTKREDTMKFIKAELEANPNLAKALADFQTINQAIAKAEKAIACQESKKNEDKEPEELNKASMEAVLDSVLDALEEGKEITEEFMEDLSKKHGIPVEKITEIVDDYFSESEGEEGKE